MRPKEPTSFTAFASQMIHSDGVVIKDERVSLEYDERYFFDEALQIDLEDIETFVLREDCPMLYLLDKKGTIHSYDIYRKRLQKEIFTIEIEENSCVDMVHYKNLIYVLDNSSLRVFSLITWQLLWERDVTDATSMSIDEKGAIYIAAIASNVLLKIDTGGAEIESIIIEGVQDPISIAYKDSKLYILDSEKVTIYDPEEQTTVQLSEEVNIPSSLAITSTKTIYIGSAIENASGSLWYGTVETKITNQVDTYNESIKKIVFDAKDSLFVLDTEGFISLVTLQKVYKNSGEIAHIFDSTFEGCDWHKMEVDYEIPDDKGLVTIHVGAVDHVVPSTDITALPPLPISFENKKDIYLHNMIGRYLVVKVTLQSDPQGEDSPLFEKVKVHFPKETYLQYLPNIYQEDAQSKELMERYLSVFQNIMEGIEDKIEKSHLLIDPETSPDSEFLNWLSAWVGLNREKNWSDAKWRELLTKAVYFFKKRGTRSGLSELIELYTQIEKEENKSIIIEPFQTRCEDGSQLFDLGKYTFCVIFKPNVLKSAEELKAVKRIVKLWKPAHTEGKVAVLREKMILGDILYLEINTSLKEDPFILGEAALSIDTKLADIEESAQIQSHARLGIDTQINY